MNVRRTSRVGYPTDTYRPRTAVLLDDVTMLQDCPECALPAEVSYRGRLAATDGAMDHVFVRCVVGHWFLGPLARLIRDTTDQPPGR